VINQLKRKLAEGRVVLGTFITLNCPDLVEIATRNTVPETRNPSST